MPGQALHQLDALMCHIARDNICWNLDHDRIAKRVAALDPRLAAYVQAGHPYLEGVSPVGEYLLSEQEFVSLIGAVTGLDATLVEERSLQPDRPWMSGAEYFRLTRDCTAEIREHVSDADALEWARRSGALVKKLTARNTLLAQGVEAVRDFCEQMRFYLLAMEERDLLPPPQGVFPTPMNPAPDQILDPNLGEQMKIYVDKMRKAIAEHPKGEEASATGLIKHIGVNREMGLRALRFLKSNGEYRGFRRSKAN